MNSQRVIYFLPKLAERTMISPKLIAALVFATTIIVISSLDIYIPATPFLSDFFGVEDYIMKMTFLMGPLAALLVSIPVGHFSDVHGRRPVFHWSLGVFVIGTAICTFAPNITFFFIGRFILSMGGAGMNILCGAILADTFKGVTLAKYLGIYSSLFPIVFGISPIVGANILTCFGWRWIFGVLTIAMILMAIPLVKFLPETRIHNKKEEEEDTVHFLSRLWKVMGKSSTIILSFAHTLPIAINGIFMVNSPFLFIDTFKFGPVGFSIIQAVPIVFQFIGALCYRFMLRKSGPEKGLKIGFITTLTFMAGVTLTLLHWIPQNPYLIVAVLSLFSFGASFIISSAATLLLDAHSHKKGLAMSIMVLIRNSSIFGILSLASCLSDDSIYPIFGSMVGVAIILLVFIYRSIHLK